MKTLIEKLVQVQSELKAPKSQRNSFGNYNYRKAEDILEAVKPILQKQGLFLSLSDEITLIGDRFYVKATATITDGENSQVVSALAREEETKKGMDGSQITGASSSYARKYALNGLFAIDDTADSDQTNDGKGDQKQTAQSTSQSTTQQASKPKEEKKPSGPVELKPGSKLWPATIKWIADNGITEEKWPEIKSKYYIITEEDEKQLFSEAGFLPF